MSIEKICSFNDQQLSAIEHLDGPCLVCAGPGSGKTTVIVNRVLHLINKYQIDPAKILVITYTKAAAEEMKHRFLDLAEGSDSRTNVSFGTFHSFFFKILKMKYKYDLNTILGEQERHSAIKNIVKTLNMQNYEDAESIKSISSEISNYKSAIDNLGFKPSAITISDFQRILACYESYKEDCRKIDFDDMLAKCYQLLCTEPTVLNRLQKQYQYILIDEFQDINDIQFAIVEMLAHPRNNLFVVGDDDQSIYSFRGARPHFILGFSEKFPDTRKIIVNQNYRSQQRIIDAANQLIEKNATRISKASVASKAAAADIRVIYPENRVEECKEIINEISKSLEKGYQFKDIAVIYRTNLLANSVINSLLENQIPFRCRDYVNNIYEHWVVEDILAYLRAAINEADNRALASIINKPTRYIPRSLVELSFNDECLLSGVLMKGELKPYQLKRIILLQQELGRLKNMKPYDAIAAIRRDIGYDKHIEDYCLEKQVSSNDLMELLDEFQELSVKCSEIRELLERVSSFKAQLKKQRGQKAGDNEVQLLTMHSAKGLEFKVVMLIGAIEGLVPHSKASAATEALEEERRLCYVAVTRAKEDLIISSPRYRYDKKAEPSRFISELGLNSFSEAGLAKGDEVNHSYFGKGLVEKITGSLMTVRFLKTNQIKELDMLICLKNNLLRK